MASETYSQIDELRQLLNELSEAGADYEKILEISERLDKRIVSFHRQSRS